jgi:hypothetical protein
LIRATRKKWLSILLTLAMLVGLMVPLAAPAAAAENYSALQVPNVNDGTDAKLGTVFAKFTAGQLDVGDSVIISLPEDFEFVGANWGAKSATVSGGVYNKFGAGDNYILIPQTYSSDPNGLYGNNLKISVLDTNEIKVTIEAKQAGSDLPDLAANDAVFYLYLGKVHVDDGYDGDIEVTFDSPSGSGFADGSVVVGRVTGGEVTVSVKEVESFSDNHPVTLRIEEDTPGALADGDESLKFVLPSGFEWGSVTITPGSSTDAFDLIWGGNAEINGVATTLENEIKVNADGDELTIDLPDGFETTEDTVFELTVTVKVEDETDAQPGDVVVKVRGDSDVSPQEIIVGQYGEYDVTIDTKGEIPTIFAGKFDQVIADIVIKESVEGSLVNDRTIILTLPDNARWGKVDEDNDSGVQLDFAGFPGSDGKAAKWVVKNGPSNDAAELVLEDMEIIVEPGSSGDIVVEVSGTAGLDGELTVAKVTPPVSISAQGKPNVKIGTVSEVGDLTITETEAGALDDDKDIILDLPEGVKWASKPKVEVTEGDLELSYDGIKTQGKDGTDDNQLVIPVDNKSTEPSTIKLTGVKLVVDRTVPEGDIAVKVQGNAALQTKDTGEIEDYFGTSNYDPGDSVTVEGFSYDLDNGVFFDKTGTAAKTVVATVGTPAPEEVKQVASFVIGSTTYTVNGVENTMDVAAYTKDGRTYLPVRYVAYALGITPENILWDGSKATFISNGRVVQVTPGSSILSINGAPVTMDVVTEVVNGRVMVPFRWVAQAFGAQVEWDDATKTVTMTL